MRGFNAAAQGEADAPIERCFELVADVAAYPSWYPSGVKYAEALERRAGGEVTKVATTLALAHGPIQRDFRLTMAVTATDSRTLELRRLPKQPGDLEQFVITWRLSSLAPERTRIGVDLNAELEIPRFLPLGGIADHIAGGFLNAALTALRSG